MTETPPPAGRRRTTINRGLLAAGAAVAILAGTIGLASADSGTPASAPSGGIPAQYGTPPASLAQDGAAPGAPDGHPCPGGGGRHHGPGGHDRGVPDPSGTPSGGGGTAPQRSTPQPSAPAAPAAPSSGSPEI